jgi:hypothetical protein
VHTLFWAALCAGVLFAPAAQAQIGCPVIQTVPGGPGQGTPGGPATPGSPGAPDTGTTQICPPINEPPDGSISAAPSVCNLNETATTCASTITWSSQFANSVEVRVLYHENGTSQVFSTAKNASSVAPWINAAGMRFDLRLDGTLWQSVEVRANPPPSVSLAAPAAGAVVISGQTSTLTASASDADGVSKVEFFDGATLIATDSSAPYSVPWSSTALGSHSLSARATDTRGAVRTSLPVLVTVAKITLSATNKTVTSSVASGGTASAAFRLASAGKLRFQTSVGGAWVEQSPLEEWLEPESGVTAAQFEVLATSAGGVLPSSGAMNQWLNLGSATRDWVLSRSVAGTSQALFTIQIRRVGTTAVLASTTVTLNATVTNIPPNVTWAGPAANSVFQAGDNVPLSATATDSDGTISKVEFFKGSDTTPLGAGVKSGNTYAFTWSNVPAGSYTLTAKATDNGGASTISSPSVPIIVNAPPSVTMPTPPAQTAPAGGTCTFSLSATANDSDGSIAQVEFFNNGVPLTGTTGNPNPDTTAPYAFTWSNVAPGSYNLSARATDNRGATALSPAVTATCGGPPMATLTGPAANTSYTRPAGPTLTATASTSTGTIARVEFLDNGAVIGSDSTPNASGQYTYPSDTTTWDTTTVSAGSHSLTARAVNSLGTVGPLSPAVPVTLIDPLPTVNLTAPSNGASFPQGQSIPLSASASITLGTITQVEFFDGAASIAPPDTIAPYAIPNWTPTTLGSHTLTAKATSSLGTSKVSAPAVTITITNPPPTITLTAPSAGANFTAPANITLSATASDANGSISQVEFFKDNGATLLKAVLAPPYTYLWPDVPVGSYSITARATDSLNASTDTPSITISVTEPAMCFVLPLRPGSVP